MKSTKVLVLLTFLLFCNKILISSESHILDSLKTEIAKSSHDTTKIYLFFCISEIYQDTGINIDSAIFYSKRAIDIANKNKPKEIIIDKIDETDKFFVKYEAKAYYVLGYCFIDEGKFDEATSFFEEAIALCKSIDSKEGIAENYTPLGVIQYAIGNYEGAINYFQKGLDIFIELEDTVKVASSYNNIGIIYRNQGLYDKAMENYMFSLKVYEEAGNKRGEASANLNIGIIHNEQSDYEQALQYYFKARDLFESIGAKRELNRLYNNIGLVYNKLAKELEKEEDEKETKQNEEQKQEYYEKALEYFKNSLSVAREINDKYAIAANYINIGSIYKDLNKFYKALDPLHKAVRLNNELGDNAGQAMVYSNLSDLYYELFNEIKEYDDDKSIKLKEEYIKKAVEYGENSYKIAVEIGSLPTQRSAASSLIDAFMISGNTNKALEFAKIYIKVNQKVYNEERSRVISEMQSKYEAEKKQLEIENLSKENALRVAELAQSEEQRKRQQTILYSFILGFIIIAVFTLIVLRLFVQKKKANILLAKQRDEILEKNAMLGEANEEIRAQKEEIEVQHDMVVKQKEFIEKQKLRTEDSIRYAQRIQNAVLPAQEDIKTLIDDYFVLYQPKDVVSGDFYWATSEGEWSIIVAADCTGHGVPGAFMSMLGISFLNQIINKRGFTNAAQVLQELRELIIKALKQTYDEDSQVDGMDISLLAINKKTLKAHWAGAQNPIWIIRNNSSVRDAKNPIDIIEIIKGDKMPVSLHVRMDNFKNHEIELKKGDRIYLFSDGFADQFGGNEGRKFNSKALKTIIAETSTLPMQQQKEMLEQTLDNWKNPKTGIRYDQIDDVVVFGVKV